MILQIGSEGILKELASTNESSFFICLLTSFNDNKSYLIILIWFCRNLEISQAYLIINILMRKTQNLAFSALKYRSLLNQNKCGLYIHEYQAYDLLKKYQLPLVPVLYFLFRASELALLKTLMPLLRELCQKLPKTSLLLMWWLRLRFMLVEEEKELSRNPD